MMTITEENLADAKVLWDYHQLHHKLEPTDVGIGLGSHDLGVAVHTADLFHAGYFPLIVFTGANAPTTIDRFPRGEAVHYREEAIARGVPADRILTEKRATNTSKNITLTRTLLRQYGVCPRSATLVTRPYQQRRAYATAQRVWPDVKFVSSAQDIDFSSYTQEIQDTQKVLSMLVGDTQRIITYAQKGWAVPQSLSNNVWHAYERLRLSGFTARLIHESNR